MKHRVLCTSSFYEGGCGANKSNWTELKRSALNCRFVCSLQFPQRRWTDIIFS